MRNFRQNLEEKSRESDGLASIVESVIDAVITIDGNQTILLFNRAAEKMFCCPADEAVGHSIERFIPERFHASHSSHIKSFGQTDVATRDMAATRAVYGLRANGEEFPVEASISQVTVDGQKLFTVIMRDITERLRVEEEYFKLASIVESSGDAIISKDFNGRILSWNKGAEHIFGYTAQEAVGQNITILFPAELLGEEQEILAKIRRGEYIKHYETVRKRKDGSQVEISLTVSPIRNKTGEIIGVSKIARDITEQKRAERQLRESHQNFRALVQVTTQAVWEADEYGRSDGIADWWQDLTGQNLARLAKWEWLEALHPDDRETAGTAWAEALANKTLFDVEYRVKDQNKEYQHFAVRGVPVINDDGRFRQWIGTFTNITEKKQAIENVLRSEERYRLLFESNPLPLIIYNFDTLKITDVNEATCLLYGYTREEILSLTLRDFGSEEDLNSIMEKVRNNTDSLTTYGSWKHRKKDGTEIFVETTSHKLEIKGENSRLVLINDVTQRKLAEMELRQWADAFENCAHGIAIGNSKTNHILACNPAFARICGKSIEEIVDFPVLSVYEPSVHEQVKNFITTADRDGHVKYESMMRRKDGTVFQSQMDIVSVPNEKGEIVYRVATMQDISERKKAEDALRQSEERYRLLFESNPHPMWVYDIKTLAFLEVNDAAIYHYGYSRDEFLSMTIKDIRPSEDIPELLENLPKPDNYYQMAKTWRHRKKDGSIIEVETTAHSFIFNGREARLILAIDVTERKNLELQLHQSQKMEAIGQLAGGVAHDFNNMLTAINGYSEMILRQLRADDPLRNKVLEINKAGQRSASLTRQLLVFSRKQILQTKILDLNAVISEIEKMLRRLIGENIDCRTILDLELGSIKADPGQIEQVIMNLVVNARDAMPQGGKLIIETRNIYLNEEYSNQHISVDPGCYVMLAVSDTGIGMNAETQSRIFEPFFTTKELGKGTGLGLSTVYGIVKQSGGSIWAYSEMGQGTTFKVYLPCVDEIPQDNGKAKIETIGNGTETILLVEDEDVVRNLTREVLESYGYQVLEAANGGSALLICEKYKQNIDLLITDVIMPELNGPELAKRLSQIHPEMKILYMSGYTDNALANQGIFDEGINFIEKPFFPDGLSQKVREILEKTSK